MKRNKYFIIFFISSSMYVSTHTHLYIFHVMPMDDERFFPSLVKVTPHY